MDEPRTSPVWLNPGDRVRCIVRVGTLRPSMTGTVEYCNNGSAQVRWDQTGFSDLIPLSYVEKV